MTDTQYSLRVSNVTDDRELNLLEQLFGLATNWPDVSNAQRLRALEYVADRLREQTPDPEIDIRERVRHEYKQRP